MTWSSMKVLEATQGQLQNGLTLSLDHFHPCSCLLFPLCWTAIVQTLPTYTDDYLWRASYRILPQGGHSNEMDHITCEVLMHWQSDRLLVSGQSRCFQVVSILAKSYWYYWPINMHCAVCKFGHVYLVPIALDGILLHWSYRWQVMERDHYLLGHSFRWGRTQDLPSVVPTGNLFLVVGGVKQSYQLIFTANYWLLEYR